MLFNDRLVFLANRAVFADKAYYCYNLLNADSITALTEDESKIAKARYGLFVAWREREALAARGALACPQEIERLSKLNALHHAMKTIVSLQVMDSHHEEIKIEDCLEYLQKNEKTVSKAATGIKHKLLWWCHENCRAFFLAYAKLSLYQRKIKNRRKLVCRRAL
jgi:hypothetical protein